MNILELSKIDAAMIDLAGGKATGLGEMLRAGERVPDGFCVTTAAYEIARAAREGIPHELRDEIMHAYQRLGAGAVAVRSSATVEDLPDASFAGQQDTFLGVRGIDALLEAIRGCWDSLWTDRAVRYREANGTDPASVRMAVVVQRMVDAKVAGVLFTANPVTGTRTQMVVDAAPGLGTAVVEGTVNPDHYILDDGRAPHQAAGCLTQGQLAELRDAGKRLRDHFGSPQDAEWAIDAGGTLWLLQSRPITALFPLPPQTDRPEPRVYLSASAVQGVLAPLTPMGMCAMQMTGAAIWNFAGDGADPIDGPPGFVEVGGRVYLDITAAVRSKSTRKRLPEQMKIQGPRVARAVERVLEDPRFAPRPGLPFRVRSMARIALRFGPPAAVGIASTLARPAAARERMSHLAKRYERRTTAPDGLTTGGRLAFIEDATRASTSREFIGMMWPLVVGLACSQAPTGLLSGIASESEMQTVLRGMPHNVTTEMNLELWRLATNARERRELLLHTPPGELAARYRNGTLQDIGLDAFLERYGRRGAAEIDVGVPHWGEDPTPVFAALAGYLRVTDPEDAPDRRFAAAAAEAEAKLDELVRRGRRRRPVRAALAGFAMRRTRELAGLRELPKFAWLHALDQMRGQLLAAGSELSERGLLNRPDDIMFLDLREARAVAEGADLGELIGQRRATYVRESKRRHIPNVLLSDGTDPEAEAPSVEPDEGVLAGMAAAPGEASGPARVVRDPAEASLEPGEILVAPSTDPGWTPLFLTAAGLVTETGTPVAHGPTVAREYGIPAVVGIADATRHIRSGQRITIDGATGTVGIEPNADT